MSREGMLQPNLFTTLFHERERGRRRETEERREEGGEERGRRRALICQVEI